MENNTAELKDFIEKLITSQNELIRNLGVNISADEGSPFDSVFDAVIDTARRAKKDASEVLKRERAELEGKITIKEKELSEALSENEKLESLIVEKEEVIREKEEKIQYLENKLNAANKKLEEIEREYISNVEKLESEYTDKIRHLKEELLYLENKNAEEINKIKEELSEKCETADEFLRHAEPYKALLDKICSCKSLADYCEQHKLNNNSNVGNILKFIKMVTGPQYARTLLMRMKEYKRLDTYPVSRDEIELMKEVNTFFRNKYPAKVTEDILYFPSGVDNDQTSGLSIPYNLNEMKNIDSVFSPKYVTEIITPCCKIDDAVEPAYVRGKSEG